MFIIKIYLLLYRSRTFASFLEMISPFHSLLQSSVSSVLFSFTSRQRSSSWFWMIRRLAIDGENEKTGMSAIFSFNHLECKTKMMMMAIQCDMPRHERLLADWFIKRYGERRSDTHKLISIIINIKWYSKSSTNRVKLKCAIWSTASGINIYDFFIKRNRMATDYIHNRIIV